MNKTTLLMAAALLLTYSVFVSAFYVPAHAAQSQVPTQIFEEVWKNSAQLGDMQDRITRNEVSSQITQAKVDGLVERLAKVEATLETGNRLHLGEIGGILALLVEKALSLTKRRRGGGDGA